MTMHASHDQQCQPMRYPPNSPSSKLHSSLLTFHPLHTPLRSLALHPKRPPTRRLPLPLLVLRPCPIQHLQEIGRPSPHPAVDVRFRGFDMVVEVVAEGLDVGDGLGAPLGGEMPGEEN